MATRIILIFLWGSITLVALTQYAEEITEAKVAKPVKIIAGLIVLAAAPIICAHTAVTGLLDLLLGINDETGNFKS